jgi:hypothetical protein
MSSVHEPFHAPIVPTTFPKPTLLNCRGNIPLTIPPSTSEHATQDPSAYAYADP